MGDFGYENKYSVFREMCAAQEVRTNIWRATEKIVFLCGVSLIRPAPFELPQGRKAARVEGCSGAM